MGLDTSAFDASLKNVYQPGLREQINEKTTLLDLFTEDSIARYEFQGRNLIFDLHNARDYSGVKYIAEGAGLPTAGAQGTKDLTIPVKSVFGRIELTERVMKVSRTDKGAFIRAMDLAQKGIVNDVSRQRNRALAGFGVGTLGVVSPGANSTTQTIINPGGVVGTTNPTRFLKVGMVVAITDPTGVTIRDVQAITAVATTTIVFAVAINTTTNDIVTLGTTSLGVNEDSYTDESMGILGLVDSTTYVTTIFGLDRSLAANAFFRSQILTSVGTLNQDIIQRGVDNVEEVSGQMIDKFVCHSSLRREIQKLVQPDIRYTISDSNAHNFDTGSQAGAGKKDLSFNGWSFRTDKDMAYGTLVGLNTEHLFHIPLDKGSWSGAEGDPVLLRVANKANYEGRFRIDENFMCDQGNTCVRFDGVTVTVTSGTVAD